jgi:hypothetical protein
VLVLIGKGWLKVENGKRRLFDPGDVLRVEIEEAILLGVPLIPVLVDDAQMPSKDDLPESMWPLLRLNSARLSVGTFRRDVEQLINAVLEDLEAPR